MVVNIHLPDPKSQMNLSPLPNSIRNPDATCKWKVVKGGQHYLGLAEYALLVNGAGGEEQSYDFYHMERNLEL
jgi:hypothetical protein